MGMDTTLLVPSGPFGLRPLNSDKAVSSNQQGGGQNGGVYSVGNGLKMELQSLPLSTDVFGETDVSLRRIDGIMADLDASKYAMGWCSNNGMQIPNPYYTPSNGNAMGNRSSTSNESNFQENAAIDSAPSSESFSPRAKPTTAKKRGRPRKAQPSAKAAAISKADASFRARCRTSSKGNAVASGSDDPKALRVRKRNRLAADKCRSRRRQEEDKLKSQHHNLERDHVRLSGAISELKAETYLLKNMLMNHGSCDCRLIQNYLKESASKWVANKRNAST